MIALLSSLRPRRLLQCTAAGLLAVGLLAPAALAHSALLDAVPDPGSRLASPPSQIELNFSEPLNRGLSSARLVNASTGRTVPATGTVSGRERLVLRPTRKLPRAPYRVAWHTVSTLDGHALEGSISFGVQTAAVGGEATVEQSPLARGGEARVALRGIFYAALFFFAGGLFVATLLSRGRPPGDWLVPDELRRDGNGKPTSPIATRAWALTVSAGWLALAAAVAVTLIETADAAGGLSAKGIGSFLLSEWPGLARLGMVAAVGLAVVLASRARVAAVGFCALAFLAIALGGHANSAHPRAVAVGTDWLHLLGGAVWIGGLAQVAATWALRARAVSAPLRRAVLREVLDRFGRIALPAFALVVASGLANALIQLGHPSELWQSSYGRVLALKVGLVAAVAGLSYWHALRLRPRLLDSNGRNSAALERRHWRLLGTEPLVALGVAAAAALLVAFPLPPRQLKEEAKAKAPAAAAACTPSCPLPLPSSRQLSVADHAGAYLVAGWIQPQGTGIAGRVRLFGLNMAPARVHAAVPGAGTRACGPGCVDFAFVSRPSSVGVRVSEKGRTYTATLPARWVASQSSLARRILNRAQRTMRRLKTMRQYETITSGPGSFVGTDYQLQAPDRFSYRTSEGGQAIVIGEREWDRLPGGRWTLSRYGGGGPPFHSASWFRWSVYARAVRLLGIERRAGGRVAHLALMDPGTPVWFRLDVDLSTGRVPGSHMIADGHFMNDRNFAFNRPLNIRSPHGG